MKKTKNEDIFKERLRQVLDCRISNQHGELSRGERALLTAAYMVEEPLYCQHEFLTDSEEAELIPQFVCGCLEETDEKLLLIRKLALADFLMNCAINYYFKRITEAFEDRIIEEKLAKKENYYDEDLKEA